PAWQKAFDDLRWSPRLPAVKPAAGKLDWLTGRLLTPDKLPTPSADALERLGRLKPPELSRWMPPLPSMSRPSLPAASAPAMPSTSNLGTLATWLLSLGLVTLVAWQASRWLKLGQPATATVAAGLGPWPVDPALVATRAELVQAFDYLALLMLGPPARSW